MATTDATNASATAVHRQMNQFRALVQRYHADPDYRRQVEADPVAAFREQSMELPSNIAVRVLTNTDDTFYMVLPPDPNTGLGDELLAAMAGSGSVSSAGTVSSVGSAACPAGSISSMGSAATASTVGCA